ncbi:hypothetical protein P154DRAFT_593424 [Amniculicola lignicola CBS 123094]|uniref:Glutaredoxin-like protein n=1 Tax=Amniculicola lignicola CBS 123094 TaxID=1392246 RepID=A0A6A5WPG5_9PLEO|nr:hypothetical protein P154DRAFT_593424 [Amniculicola lignicola CBS 123094]
MFRATSRLFDCRITLFTRVNCSLCDTAKSTISKVQKNRPFAYHEVNVMDKGQEQWKAVYEFDTPVIHVDQASASETTIDALKLMHRFTGEDVMQLMDEAEKR